MKFEFSRRRMLGVLTGTLAGLVSAPAARAGKATVQKLFTSANAAKGYDPSKHKWLMSIDVDRCIGCGLCVDACKTENHVPQGPTYFRTWIERYIIKKPVSGQDQPLGEEKSESRAVKLRGEVLVDSPNGGRNGFPATTVDRKDILKSFFVPKLCNLCEASPCTQVCPVGATFDTPDGAVLVDPKYCIGCGFCIQACPYGCRFLNPETRTAEKCTLCYHRITRGLKPACVEVCPTEARIFGDLKNPVENDPIQAFVQKNKVFSLKPHLGTEPRVLYANLDKEVR